MKRLLLLVAFLASNLLTGFAVRQAAYTLGFQDGVEYRSVQGFAQARSQGFLEGRAATLIDLPRD